MAAFNFKQLLKSMGNNSPGAPRADKASPAGSSGDLLMGSGGSAAAAKDAAAPRAVGAALPGGTAITFDAGPGAPPQLAADTLTVYATDGGPSPHTLCAACPSALAYGLSTGAVRLLSRAGGGGAKALAKGVHAGPLSDLAFAPGTDGPALLASAGRDGTVGLWAVDGAGADFAASRLAAVDLATGGGGGPAGPAAARVAWHPAAAPGPGPLLALACGGGEEPALLLARPDALPGAAGPPAPLPEVGATGGGLAAVPLAGAVRPPAGGAAGLAWSPDGRSLAAAFGSSALLARAPGGAPPPAGDLDEYATALGGSAASWTPHGPDGPIAGLAWAGPGLLVSAGGGGGDGGGEVALWDDASGGAAPPTLLHRVSIADAGRLAALAVLKTGATTAVVVSAPGRARVFVLTLHAEGGPARFGAGAAFSVGSPVLSAVPAGGGDDDDSHLLAVHADGVRLLAVDMAGCAAAATEGGREAAAAGVVAAEAAEEVLPDPAPAQPPPPPAAALTRLLTPSQLARERVSSPSPPPAPVPAPPPPPPPPPADSAATAATLAAIKAEGARASAAADAMSARLASFEADQRDAWKRTRGEVKKEVTAAVAAALAAGAPAAAAAAKAAAAKQPSGAGTADPAALAASLATALPGALAGPAARASLEAAVAAAVSRALPPALDAALAAALSPPALASAFASAFESSLIPRFEAACRELFSQVNATFAGGLAEHLQASAGVSSAAAAGLKEAADRVTAVVERAERAAAAVAAAGAGAAPPPPPHLAPPPAAQPPADPAAAIATALGSGDYDAAFTTALDAADPALLAAATAAVEPGAAAPALSQPVLLTLLQQLGVGLAAGGAGDPGPTIAWVREAALALDPRAPALGGHVRPILAGVLDAVKGVAAGGGPSSGEARLALHVVNSVLHQCG